MAVFSALFGSGPTREEMVKRRAQEKPTAPSPTTVTTRTKGDAPVIGQAQPRGTFAAEGNKPTPPPDTLQLGQNNDATARAAALRARRKGAGAEAGTVLTSSVRAPRAVLNRRTLLGNY